MTTTAANAAVPGEVPVTVTVLNKPVAFAAPEPVVVEMTAPAAVYQVIPTVMVRASDPARVRRNGCRRRSSRLNPATLWSLEQADLR